MHRVGQHAAVVELQQPSALNFNRTTSLGAGRGRLRQGAFRLRCADAGGVAERLKAHAWKVCIRETVSRVRIPLPPPNAQDASTRSVRHSSHIVFLWMSQPAGGADPPSAPARAVVIRPLPSSRARPLAGAGMPETVRLADGSGCRRAQGRLAATSQAAAARRAEPTPSLT